MSSSSAKSMTSSVSLTGGRVSLLSIESIGGISVLRMESTFGEGWMNKLVNYHSFVLIFVYFHWNYCFLLDFLFLFLKIEKQQQNPCLHYYCIC